jgi:hypothetical protein
MTSVQMAISVIAGVTLLGSGPSQAEYATYGNGRYCAVVSAGDGSAKEICDFNDFETCRMEVVSGNRGFCRDNPYWMATHSPQWDSQPEGWQTGMGKSKRKPHRH